MATAEHLRALIATCQQEVQQVRAKIQEGYYKQEKAQERQNLRQQLEKVEAEISSARDLADGQRNYWMLRDSVFLGDNLSNSAPKCFQSKPVNDESTIMIQGQLDYSAFYGQWQARIQGLLWLPQTLQQRCGGFAMSSSLILLCDHYFSLCYHPTKGEMGEHGQRAPLAIFHTQKTSNDDVFFSLHNLDPGQRAMLRSLGCL